MVDLGNIYYKTGQLPLAKQSFTDALRAFKNYYPALCRAGEGASRNRRRRRSRSRTTGARRKSPRCRIMPRPCTTYIRRPGQDAEAAKQMDLLDMIDKVSSATGEKANRNLVLAFADHDMKLDRALELAQGELEFRRDIYTYDALAWALYKNHRTPKLSSTWRRRSS